MDASGWLIYFNINLDVIFPCSAGLRSMFWRFGEFCSILQRER